MTSWIDDLMASFEMVCVGLGYTDDELETADSALLISPWKGLTVGEAGLGLAPDSLEIARYLSRNFPRLSFSLSLQR